MLICEHVVHLQMPDLYPLSLWTFSSQESILALFTLASTMASQRLHACHNK